MLLNTKKKNQTHSSHQWLKLRVFDKAELRDEVVVVFIAGVDMSLSSHVADAVKVVDINMHKHTEEPTKDLFADLLKVLRKRNP